MVKKMQYKHFNSFYNHQYSKTATNYIIKDDDFIVYANSGIANIDVNLSMCNVSTEKGRKIVVKAYNPFGAKVYVKSLSNENIEGVTSFSLTDRTYKYPTASFICSGIGTWYVVAEKMS